MKNNKTRSICVYTCTIYTYMHHQIPPKYDIPSWPSLWYSMKDQVKMRDLCWISCFCCFQVLFMKSAPLFIEKVPLFMKTNKTMSICVYTCTIYTYIHHIHYQIPPKYKIYLVGLPSVLYKTPGQNKRSVLNQLFLLLFSAFHRKCWFSYKKYHFSWKPTKPGQYVCIHGPFIHTCTTTYQTKMIYLVGLPSVLYERPGLCWNERSVLNENQQNQVNMCFCTIYTYMHHQIPPKFFSWPFHVLWKTRSKWEICVESVVFVVFHVLFSPFHVLFMKSITFHTKSANFHEKKQNQVNMCVYMYHLHIHAPPNTTKIWFS